MQKDPPRDFWEVRRGGMKVSVLLVCYNQEKYIRKAVESILMQKVSYPVEIIVGDDCSTDSTLEIIKNCESDIKNKNNMHVERRGGVFNFVYFPPMQNLGIFKNYKRCFDKATGDYLVILEGDDFWSSPYHIQQHINFLEEHGECSMCMNRFVLWWEKDFKWDKPSQWPYTDDYFYVDVNEQADGNRLGNLSACTFRKSVVGQFDQSMFEKLSGADWLLGIAAAEHGLIGILKDVTSVYRLNSNSTWAAKSKKEQALSVAKGCDAYDEFFNYKYTKSLTNFKNRMLGKKRIGLKNLIKMLVPPFIVQFVKWICPPIVISIVKKLMGGR